MISETMQDLKILMLAPSRVLAAVLRKELGDMAGVQTVSCKNIAEALGQMHAARPDLVVSSMYFEDGDGIDLITAMRNDEPLSGTLFMLISSETRFEMLGPVRQAGVAAMLSRPFTEEALTQAVQNTLGYSREGMPAMDYQKLGSLKILLVNGNRQVRRQSMEVLEKMGITPLQVLQAESVDEAIQILQAEPIDLVLADGGMPQAEGEELLKSLRQNAALDRIPVIMTVSGSADIRLASIKSQGATVMIDRPFDPASLKSLMERHF